MVVMTELAEAISQLSFEQTVKVYEILDDHRKNLQRAAVSTLRVGEAVNFQSKKRGRRVSGIVVKRNATSVTVQETGGGTWRVAPSFLRKGA